MAALAAQGLSHKEVAQRLGLAPATVRNQLAQVYQRLEVHNVIALAQAMQQAC